MAQQKSINLSAVSGDQTIHDVASTAVKTAVHDYSLITSGAGTLVVKDAAGTEFGRYTFAAAGDGIVRPPIGDGSPRFVAVGDLILNLSASLTVTGDFTYSTI